MPCDAESAADVRSLSGCAFCWSGRSDVGWGGGVEFLA